MTKEKILYLNRLKSKHYLNRKICKSCGGQCCMAASCLLMPCDIFPFTSEQIISLIDKEYLSIEVFFKPGKIIPYLAIREVGHDIFSILTSHSCCSMLDKNGCKFSPDVRPLSALAIIPSKFTFPDCASMISIAEIITSWEIPDNAYIMSEVIQYYSPEKTIEDLVIEKFQQFENEILNNTCLLSQADKYLVYRSGMIFEYAFRKNIRNLIFK